MGKKSRDKGARFERAIVNALKDSEFAAERVPLSGASGGSFAGDVMVDFGLGEKKLEAKVRGDGFKQIYEWLGINYGLVIKADRREPLLVLRLAEAACVAAEIKRLKQDAANRQQGGGTSENS